MMQRILIVSATMVEISDFIAQHRLTIGEVGVVGRHEVIVEISGVGVVAATFNITRFIEKHKPSMVIQAGIAGCYAGSGLKVGDVVVVEGEVLADMGVFTDSGFERRFGGDILWGNVYYDAYFPRVISNTVSSACAPHVNPDIASIESMEGYALFYVCRTAGVKFMELRSISNLVAIDRSSWNVKVAVERLKIGLNEILSGSIENL